MCVYSTVKFMAWVRIPGAAENGIVCLQLTISATALTRCVVSTIKTMIHESRYFISYVTFAQEFHRLVFQLLYSLIFIRYSLKPVAHVVDRFTSTHPV